MAYTKIDKASMFEVVQLLDIPTLMVFRGTSKECMSLVNIVLRSDFKQILQVAVPDVEMLLYAMDEMEGFVAGYAALAFFRRRSHDITLPLQLFVPDWAFTTMAHHLRTVQHATLLDSTIRNDEVSGIDATATFVGTTAEIILYASVSEASLLPVARFYNSALMCYIGGSHFGVVWPRLTFKSRGLVGDEVEAGCALRRNVLKRLGIDSKLYAWMWPGVGRPQECASSDFLCPAQPRYFTDGGALRIAWEAFGNTGDMNCDICFRMDGRPCGGVCLTVHPLLGSAEKRIYVWNSTVLSTCNMSAKISSSDSEREVEDMVQDISPPPGADDLPIITPPPVDIAGGFDKHSIVVNPGIRRSAMKRLRRLACDFEFPLHDLYSLTKVPNIASWDDSWEPTALALYGSPVALRVLGSIANLQFVSGAATSEITLDLELMRGVDHDALVVLLKKGRPVPDRFPEYMRLTHKMEGPRPIFASVYDTTHLLRPVHCMKTVGLSTLTHGDVVLVEGVCVQEDDGAGFKTAFELLSMAVIAKVG
ncbi:hypothetical protein VTO73DRAFT_8913 [Trametes versicolor]